MILLLAIALPVLFGALLPVFKLKNALEIPKGDKDLIEQLLTAMEVLAKLNTNYRLRILQYEAK